jgi:hypothetical protein
MEKVDALRAQQHLLETDIVRLREQIPAARASDEQRLGAALAAGEPEPAPEAPGLEAELERAQRTASL